MMGRSELFSQFYLVNDREFDLRQKDIVMENFYFQHNVDNLEEAKELKPRKNELGKLKALLKKPNFAEMETQNSFLFWKFRYYLSQNPEALPKFLKSVKWTNPKFTEEALRLVGEWSPARYDDALYMLSRTFSMNSVYKSDLEINPEDVRRVFSAIR